MVKNGKKMVKNDYKQSKTVKNGQKQYKKNGQKPSKKVKQIFKW